ncbi:MAG: hypothetical protein NT108_00365 [Candidatus Kaiserbacteria bacterium]|nr:hypothetical protein [Candidatus Kaiserbacteria bacterium]
MSIKSTVLIIAFVLCCFATESFGGFFLPSKEERRLAQTPPDPIRIDWFQGEVCLTTNAVSEMPAGTGILRVEFQCSSNNAKFHHAMVTTSLKIPVGTQIEISKIIWENNRAQRMGPDSCIYIVKGIVKKR